jgi:hypothetical protein
VPAKINRQVEVADGGGALFRPDEVATNLRPPKRSASTSRRARLRVGARKVTRAVHKVTFCAAIGR